MSESVLQPGHVAVVTGAGSGIGAALAEAFGAAGGRVVLADVEEGALARVGRTLSDAGVEYLTVPTDVSDLEAVERLARATVERFGRVDVLCNNAGVSTFNPITNQSLDDWRWVLDVNLWGVIHGVHVFLPVMLGQGTPTHIVSTSSLAGLLSGIPFLAPYSVSKVGVVSISETLRNEMEIMGLPVGVSVLCPGWVNTKIVDAERNWPAHLGEKPDNDPAFGVMVNHARRAIAEGVTPASIADAVATAVVADRFWVIPQQDFLDLIIERWDTIAERLDPDPPENVPGMPPRSQIIAEVQQLLAP